MNIDLHLHSSYSGDGIHNIGFLTNLFSSGDIVALTDHETIAGWREFKDECDKRKLRPIFGIEWFASDYHILSYFPNTKITSSFEKFMSERRRNEMLTMKNVADSYHKEYESFPNYNELLKMNSHPEDILGMLVLVCKIKRVMGIEFKDAVGAVRVRKHFFPECPKLFKTGVLIKKMANWGAVNILAHPFRRKDCDDKALKIFYKLIINYKKAGLKGIELHPFEDELNEKIKRICKRLGLIWTMGSDYHYYKVGIYPNKLNGLDNNILDGLKRVNLL